MTTCIVCGRPATTEGTAADGRAYPWCGAQHPPKHRHRVLWGANCCLPPRAAAEKSQPETP